MLIERKSQLSGKVRAKEMDVTLEQLHAYYEDGVLIQNAFPDLSPSEREFIKTGIVQEEWDDMFAEEEYR